MLHKLNACLALFLLMVEELVPVCSNQGLKQKTKGRGWHRQGYMREVS